MFESIIINEEPSGSSAIGEIASGGDEEDFIPIGAETSRNKKLTWLEAPTKLLLNRVKDLRAMVGKKASLESKKHMWVTISNELCEQGYMYTAQQVETRYYTLERQYKQTKLNNSKSGGARQICPFEE